MTKETSANSYQTHKGKTIHKIIVHIEIKIYIRTRDKFIPRAVRHLGLLDKVRDDQSVISTYS